ncbi:YcgL domain-containing protein [Pseudidiomarina gelatinasegens]|uniref:YcgL domain-containing protein n=1 Tax=Pseudidiomarina gelatinasegens TaxID=2487740 RepID=UPI003A96E259
MLCAVYRSPRRADTYLYMPHPADFTKIPEPLQQSFGQPIHVMTVALKPERKFARLSMEELTKHLNESGFYLQMPPKEPNLLDAHKKQQQESAS